MTEIQTEETQQPTDQPSDDSVDVQEAQLPEVTDQSIGEGNGQIDILLETLMPVQVQLAQANLCVQELLQLSVGSVVKLDKRAGEPVDLFLRGVRFATGQLVVIEDRLGVRINKILSPGPGRRATDQIPG
jgi:flagellar motor switch protein FliN/FliY